MNIRYAAAKALADLFAAAIPALGGNASAPWDDPESEASYPALRVIPRRLRFNPTQEESVAELGGLHWRKDLVRVGDFEGTFELRVFGDSAPQREAIEAEVEQLFFAREGVSGQVVAFTEPVVLGDVGTLYRAPVALDLDNSEWDEERVFSKQRYSMLTCPVSFPALTLRASYVLDRLYLAIANDLEATTPDETYRIRPSGALKPAT